MMTNAYTDRRQYATSHRLDVNDPRIVAELTRDIVRILNEQARTTHRRTRRRR